MTPEDAVSLLRQAGDAEHAAREATNPKSTREVLGLRAPELAALVGAWRQALTLEERLALAEGLWRSDIHEARLAAAKLLTQARMAPDEEAWRLITLWAGECDDLVTSDAVAAAGARRVMADLARLEEIDAWIRDENIWRLRTAFAMTLPLARMNFPKPHEIAARDRVLSWAAEVAADRRWLVQKTIAWWLRDLSKHDADATRAFLDAHGEALKSFARKEAASYLAARG